MVPLRRASSRDPFSEDEAAFQRAMFPSARSGFRIDQGSADPLLFANETETLDTRDPVARAEPPPTSRCKARSKTTKDGHTVHSFRSLLDHLGTIVTNHCRRPGASEGEIFEMTTQPNALQTRALDLLKTL